MNNTTTSVTHSPLPWAIHPAYAKDEVLHVRSQPPSPAREWLARELPITDANGRIVLRVTFCSNHGEGFPCVNTEAEMLANADFIVRRFSISTEDEAEDAHSASYSHGFRDGVASAEYGAKVRAEAEAFYRLKDITAMIQKLRAEEGSCMGSDIGRGGEVGHTTETIREWCDEALKLLEGSK